MNYEKAQEISSSSLWEEVSKEIDLWIAMELAALKTCTQDQLAVIQQRIKAYERVKDLPRIVKERLE